MSRGVGWAGVALVVVIVAALVPPALSRARSEHRDIRGQRVRTAQIGKLSTVVASLGGPARFEPCGEPLTRLEYQTILAWTLHDNVATVGYKYSPAIASGRPIVLFTPHLARRLAGAGATSAAGGVPVAAALGTDAVPGGAVRRLNAVPPPLAASPPKIAPLCDGRLALMTETRPGDEKSGM